MSSKMAIDNKEIAAIEACATALEGLTAEEAARVIAYIAARKFGNGSHLSEAAYEHARTLRSNSVEANAEGVKP